MTNRFGYSIHMETNSQDVRIRLIPNLLILDEVFDSSLDVAGTDYFLSIMNSFGDKTNVFVISHKGDQLVDKFQSVIKFEKRNDFSVMNTA